MVLRALLLAFCGVVLAVAATAQSLEGDLRVDSGFFNRGYQDRNWVSTNRISLSVPYGAVGSEVRHRDAEGNLWAVGLAQTTISPGKAFNRDRWEVQPATLLNFGALSVGKDYGLWELGLGVGAIVQVKDFEATGPRKPSGLAWNRRESFTLVTGLFRVLPSDGPHVALAVARGPLSLAENLMHLKAVWPLGWSVLDLEVGFSSPLGLIYHGDGVLRSNERFSLGWAFGGPGGRLGLRAGYLMRSIMEGSGRIDPFHRLSLGLDWSVSTNP